MLAARTSLRGASLRSATVRAPLRFVRAPVPVRRVALSAAVEAAELPAPVAAPDRSYVLEDTRKFVVQELGQLFKTGEITRGRYSPTIAFSDPLTSTSGIDSYQALITVLKHAFNVTFTIHDSAITSPSEVTVRWTMGMEVWALPWKPVLMFTGRSIYDVDPDTGIINRHTDVWDALEHNEFLSLEGAIHVARMALAVEQVPRIETIQYTTLLKKKEYEVRSYPSYCVAEAGMAAGAGPASGTGFTDLADYIFGNNRQRVKMQMTTPVVSTAASGQAVKMQFVAESRFASPSDLPSPNNPKIATRQEPGGLFGAIRFSGWPLDSQVIEAERSLRDMMIRDGYRPKPGYKLLRYSEPTVLPALRRNEVLIELDEFALPTLS